MQQHALSSGSSFEPLQSARLAVPEPRTSHSPDVFQPVGLVLISRNRAGLAALALALEGVPELEVLRTLEGVEQDASGLCDIDPPPDIVVLEHDHDAALSAARVAMLDKAWPGVGVVVTAVPPDLTTVVATVEAGARGLLTLESSLDELVAAIRTVARGQAACSAAVTTLMLDAIVVAAPACVRATHPTLTPRELEVIGFLERGMSNKEIARQLDIRVATVKNHVHSVLTKLELSHRGLVRAGVARLPALRADQD